ncbi:MULTISPECIES: EutN/CcmL family microcompartment protein [Eubacterium]|uniref:Ethanolamine utilization protein EutN n=1 Tax=Eubacterium barkeri TaxID=1528 RepID=A0A1H3HZQ2_EUBBA|nr:EutN/CcmL family microcompartment protein [Eubacterium barkeri]SDY20940.1 ethanolamine utilization protein EutN [Eubacterium barkeri]
MKVGEVIGSVWATRKMEKLSGFKLMLVKPYQVEIGKGQGDPFVAVDTIGAGIGERVIVVGGSSARGAAEDSHCPVDAAIIGIIDDMEIHRSDG